MIMLLPETRAIGEKLIAQELQEIENMPFFTDKNYSPRSVLIMIESREGEGSVYVI